MWNQQIQLDLYLTQTTNLSLLDLNDESWISKSLIGIVREKGRPTLFTILQITAVQNMLCNYINQAIRTRHFVFVEDELNQQLSEWMNKAPAAQGITRAVIAPYV